MKNTAEPFAFARSYKHLPTESITTHFEPIAGLDEVSFASQLSACITSRCLPASFKRPQNIVSGLVLVSFALVILVHVAIASLRGVL